MTPQQFQQTVLTWFDQFGRKNLPWQQDKTPYRVWLSEIMLQQTQVATVIPYFQRFILRFPTMATLGQATEDEVLHLWSGLGYYSRARNLHRTAKIILQEFNGKFPENLDLLQKLPGIGQSTAGAILTLAFAKKAAILDGNVRRLLTRFHALSDFPNDKKLQEQLWKIAKKYTPSHRVADYTQVMMDLGATICIRKNPLCLSCPLVSHCLAYKQRIVDQLPRKKIRRTLPIQSVSLLILQYKDKILLQKRPSTGIWGGLWSLPELPTKSPKKKIQTFCLDTLGIRINNIQRLAHFRHTFSHYHLDIFPIYIMLDNNSCNITNMDNKMKTWYSLRRTKTIGLPAPIKLLLSKLS